MNNLFFVYVPNANRYFVINIEDREKFTPYKFTYNEQRNRITRTDIIGKNITPGQIVTGKMYQDHIDGNIWNNCRNNFRPATFPQNGMNKHKYNKNATSKFKGVYYRKDRPNSPWKAEACHQFLGSFKTEIEAAIAYNNYVKKRFGEFAVLNIIPPQD